MTRRTLLRGAMLLQLPRLMHRFHRDRLLVLMYHGFTSERRFPGLGNLERNHVHVEKFSKQMEYLAKHHNIVSLREIAEAAAGGTPLPPAPVAVTVDDGYRSTYTLAFPVLQRFGVRATVFVTTGFVDDREPQWPDRVEYTLGGAVSSQLEFQAAGTGWRLDLHGDASRRESACRLIQRLKQLPEQELTATVDALERAAGRRLQDVDPLPALYEPLQWEEIRAMSASGLVTIGNHTHSHRILARCTPALQRQEIERAHALLEQNVGARCDQFCYPNGARGDYDDVTKSILRELGYVCSPTTIPGSNGLRPDPFELRRVALNDRATFDDFIMILYGGIRGLVRDLAGGGHDA